MTQQVEIPMQEHLNRNIKEIIAEFPAVSDVLSRYDIGCVSCGLGTCLFKDIIEIHALDPEQEAALMAGIARIIYPDREVILPPVERKSRQPAGAVRYSPPMKKLVDEHRLIKRWLALIPAIVESVDLGTEPGRQLVIQGIDFIRSYADRFHHAKEEDILFGYFDGNLEILKTMRADHESARARVRGMLAALDRHDKEAVAADLRAYREVLTEHIRKEDEVLYLWMDRNLTMKLVGELFSRFGDKDQECGDVPRKYEELIAQLERQFGVEEEVK